MKVIIDRQCGHYWIQPLGTRKDWMDDIDWNWRLSQSVEISEEEWSEYEKHQVENAKWQVRILQLASTLA